MSEANEKITLELIPSDQPKTEETAIPLLQEIDAEYLNQINLTEEELKTVEDFSGKIDLNDSAIILQYGAACQKKIAEFSDNALAGVRTKDLGQTSDMIADLVSELKGFDATEEEKGFLGIFKKAGSQVTRLKARYDKAENNIDMITGKLEDHQNQLLKDIIMLDKMYETNLNYFKELTMYIMAGKKKLEAERATTLPELKAKAKQSGLTHDAQAANDYAAMCDRFEKELYDLELTRTISVQMAPQIRLIQNNDAILSEKIQSTINNTIPLWKNQMVLALGLAHSKEALETQRAVTDMTNELLKKNADMLKQGTVEIAQESERGIVDIETVAYTNQQLITTLDEVLRIQDEGRAKRREAEDQLIRIETELKNKLLEIRN